LAIGLLQKESGTLGGEEAVPSIAGGIEDFLLRAIAAPSAGRSNL
jgi:hypothetical protein